METKQFPEKWAVRDTNEALIVLKRLYDNKLINATDKYGFDVQEHIDGFHCYDTNLNYQYKPFAKGYTEVTLEELIAHYEPTTHPKWMPLTKGDNKIIELKEVFEHWVVKVMGFGHKPIIYICNSEGINILGNTKLDLIPYNPRINALEEKITSKRSELAELEWELKGLKG